jgi:hypothetical protein
MQNPIRHEPNDEPLEHEELEETPSGESTLSLLAMSQLPWWVISVALHVLSVILMMLLTFAVPLPPGESDVVVVTTIEKPSALLAAVERPPSHSQNVSDRDTRPTYSLSTVSSNVEIPDYIKEIAELGNHWETNNPDRPDTQSAFGNPDSHFFYDQSGSDDKEGGGGTGGLTLDETIGVGGGGTLGTGDGWGGGDGKGIGNGKGDGRGSFGWRNGGGRRWMILKHGGSTATDLGMERALSWLARHQEADGHWDTKKLESNEKTDTACTAMALLAFLGAGHTEKIGTYKSNVKRAVEWLRSKQNADGLVFDTTDAGAHRGIGYPHAIAGMALVEAAGMSRIPETVAAAQKAVDYTIQKHQNGDGYERRGFRYGAKQDGDLSVTGWFVMQLKSAMVAGLKVDHNALEGAIKFLESVEQKGAGGDRGYGPASIYKYRPDDVHEQTAHRLTAIGTLCRQFLGWKKEDLQASVEWFVDKGGVPDGWGANKTDLYYWYYGALCTYQQGGGVWNKWNAGMKKTLVDNQRKGGDEDGSWDPVGDFAGEWGRAGQTAMACMCLEVYFRYLRVYGK